MRRNSTNQNHLRLTLICLFLVFYQVLSSLYTFLPLFVGVFFAYIVINFKDKKHRLYVYLSFIYLSIYDLDKGFYLFSSILFFMIFYYLFVNKIRNILTCRSCIIIIYVASAYLGHFLLNSFIAYILQQDAPTFLLQAYLYYILIDVILAIIILRSKA